MPDKESIPREVSGLNPSRPKRRTFVFGTTAGSFEANLFSSKILKERVVVLFHETDAHGKKEVDADGH